MAEDNSAAAAGCGDWTPELDAQARAVCGKLVAQSLGAVLRNNPELGVDDVVARCVQRVWESYGKFDPARASFSTFCGRVATWVIADVRRKHARRARLDEERGAGGAGVAAPARPEAVRDVEPDPLDGRDLLAWTTELYAGVCAVVQQGRAADPRRGPGAPPDFTGAQKLVVQAIGRKLNLSPEGVELLLRHRKDLRDAIGLTRAPSYRTVYRARKGLTQFKKIFDARLPGVR